MTTTPTWLPKGYRKGDFPADHPSSYQHITWPLVKYTTNFLQRISIISRSNAVTNPPIKTKNTPAMLSTSRLLVFPVFDFDGFGHWLRSSHHFRRVFSMKFLSRNCRIEKKRIKVKCLSLAWITRTVKNCTRSLPERLEHVEKIVIFLYAVSHQRINKHIN